MKRILTLFTAMVLIGAFVSAETVVLTPVVDTESNYTPTQIVNGDFDECPWQGFVYGGTTYTTQMLKSNPGGYLSGVSAKVVSQKLWNGVGEGWNTTETTLFPYGKLYDWTKATSGTYVPYCVNAVYSSDVQPSGGSWSFIEMNGFVQSVFYQDLKTQGGDVIRWTLNHARRGSVEERINVQIGAPERDGNGNIVPATTSLDPKIKTKGRVKFKYNGIDNINGTYGFGNTNELKYLTITTSDSKSWKDARGVYIIPENQNVTRFAFISELPSGSADGNLLDSITFSTLIGNLNAYANWDATVVITGYWGETNSSKKLKVEIGGTTHEITMSSVTHKNFKIVIPNEVVGTAVKVKIYHQDYESAAEEITIERHFHDEVLYGVWNYSDRLPTTGRYALGTDVTLAGDVTLTGNAEMKELGGAKICLNGHTISGGKVIINSAENKISIENVGSETKKTVSSAIEQTSGDLTINGATLSSLTVTDGFCTAIGLVTINSLSLATGKVLTLGSELNDGSAITLTATPNAGVITSGFGSRTLGSIINLPSTAKDYMLMKTKNGELKVSQHKSGW